MSTNEIRARVEVFTADLTALIRKAALESVHQALGGSARAHAAAQVRRKPGRPAGSKTTKPAVASNPKAKDGKTGGKRDSKVLAALVEKLHSYIKAHPAQRIEPIGVALGVATKDLALPIKKLLKAKRISSRGFKRSTSYSSAASGGGGLVLVKKKAKKVPEAKTDAASK